MAEVAGPAACEACGRQLPPQHGRGRRRRYCGATCRSAGRRKRELAGSRRRGYVKIALTTAERHGNFDDASGGSAAADPMASRIRDAAGRLADGLARTGACSPLAAMAAARELSAATSDALQETVDRARAAGHSWREIGDVLGTTRQAAFQRFGHPVDPRTGAPMSTDIPPGTADRGAAIVTCLAEGRWEDARRDFNARMREGGDDERLASGWARMVAMIGRYEGMGEPFAHRARDHAVVEIPLRFEAGEATGRVIFDDDGKVAGLWLRPARDDTEG
jgi:uncharacterized protein DUF3887